MGNGASFGLRLRYTKGGENSMEEIRREELEEQTVELLPDREEMHWKNVNLAVAAAQQGAVAQANQGVFINF